uniref:Zgc:174906 n=1 Tax=Scleropages formosus TaxID=113540 RepID=A0A8C9RAK1_SCLFO
GDGSGALLRTLKATLIDALSADPDFVLQHADSRSLLTVAQYQHIKVIADPSQKVCDLLDCVIQRGSGCSKKLLKLLKEEKIQETYPKLGFLKKFKRKRERNLEPESPIKQNCVNRAELVTERQLMILADRVGHSWKQMGLVALRITAVQLEQLEEDYPRHVERVFGMLQAWRMREGRQATAVRLYDLLSRGNFVPPESLDILLESSGITGAPSHVVR